MNCLESETLKPLIEASGEIDMRYGILGRPGEVLPKGKDGDANDISQKKSQEEVTIQPKSDCAVNNAPASVCSRNKPWKFPRPRTPLGLQFPHTYAYAPASFFRHWSS